MTRKSIRARRNGFKEAVALVREEVKTAFGRSKAIWDDREIKLEALEAETLARFAKSVGIEGNVEPMRFTLSDREVRDEAKGILRRLEQESRNKRSKTRERSKKAHDYFSAEETRLQLALWGVAQKAAKRFFSQGAPGFALRRSRDSAQDKNQLVGDTTAEWFRRMQDRGVDWSRLTEENVEASIGVIAQEVYSAWWDGQERAQSGDVDLTAVEKMEGAVMPEMGQIEDPIEVLKRERPELWVTWAMWKGQLRIPNNPPRGSSYTVKEISRITLTTQPVVLDRIEQATALMDSMLLNLEG